MMSLCQCIGANCPINGLRLSDDENRLLEDEQKNSHIRILTYREGELENSRTISVLLSPKRSTARRRRLVEYANRALHSVANLPAQARGILRHVVFLFPSRSSLFERNTRWSQ